MKTKDLVLEMITKYPALRDSDNKLTANIWNKEIKSKGMNLEAMTATELLTMVANDKLSSPVSIKRHRAKFQEVNESLRGIKYKQRQVNAQNKWKTQLKEKGVYDKINDNFVQEQIQLD
jgi:hypothetical protein